METEEKYPCDIPWEIDGETVYRCPFEGFANESERCRVCCGIGVDE